MYISPYGWIIGSENLMNNVYLPSEHVSPVHPAAHVHVNGFSSFSLQVPPFWQGAEAHSAEGSKYHVSARLKRSVI